MQENLKVVTEVILNYFYLYTKKESITLKIEYVDDLYEKRLELAKNNEDRKNIINNKQFIKGLNGTMVLPEVKDGVYYILIANEALKDYLFIGTIIHELTHIYDFIDFASEFCNENFQLVENHQMFGMFYYWTEFNARRNGYYYLRKIMFELQGTSFSKEEQLDHILNAEYKLHYDALLKDLREYSYDKNTNKYIYNIVQFMGRLSVWEDLFPEEIDAKEMIPNYLIKAYGTKIINLYDVLNSIRDFNTAKYKLGLLETTIEKLF